jgi:hypothetical protein
VLADGALRTDWSLRPLCTLRSGWTDWPCRTSLSSWTRWALRPRRWATARDHDDSDDGRNCLQLLHGRPPRRATKTLQSHISWAVKTPYRSGPLGFQHSRRSWRDDPRGTCGARFAEMPPQRPPDLPLALMRFRVTRGGFLGLRSRGPTAVSAWSSSRFGLRLGRSSDGSAVTFTPIASAVPSITAPSPGSTAPSMTCSVASVRRYHRLNGFNRSVELPAAALFGAAFYELYKFLS